MVVGFPVGGEQFAAESEFLRLTAIAEVEQCCVQQLRTNVSGFPCDIEISGEFLIGRIVQVGALGKFSPGVRYAFEVYQVAATAESVTASGS